MFLLKILCLAIFFAFFCRNLDDDKEANEHLDNNQLEFIFGDIKNVNVLKNDLNIEAAPFLGPFCFSLFIFLFL
jgi:hypothetical protein